ncbi:hypothetical protein O181_080886 [Austropuccinia psidii MF-1]|uniref:Uncharacterized protein n=1 Tax=Austropuccinia psidii MF-1 TaxID=1389203 RepID=A0A9Q3FJ22_9BASI|nr:hypothetical protein [Austropuccinia psidii MF-1]
MGTSSKPLDRDNELIYLKEEALGPRKDPVASEGMDTNVLEGTGPKDQILVEKQKNFVRGSEERVGPNKGKHTCGSSSGIKNQEYTSKSTKNRKASLKEKPEGKGKVHMEQTLPPDIQT